MFPDPSRSLQLLALLASSLGAQAAPIAARIDSVELTSRVPVVAVALTNTSKAPLAVSRPLGGSVPGLVEPKYTLRFDRRGRQPNTPRLCGNVVGDYRESDLVRLAPGATARFSVSAPVLLTPGAWKVTLEYSIARAETEHRELGALLWFGSVTSPTFEVVVPGPTWDEWIELPEAERNVHLARELSSSDSARVGMAADALKTLSEKSPGAPCPVELSPEIPRAFRTLLGGVQELAPQPFAPDRTLGQQLADLLANRLLPDPDAHREQLRLAVVRSKGEPRQALVAVLVTNLVEGDYATLEMELDRPTGQRELFRMCLEACAKLRGIELAVAKGMAVLERTPPSPMFMEYAHALSHVTGDYGPSEISLENGGKSFPFEPEHFVRAKKQWSAWWHARKTASGK